MITVADPELTLPISVSRSDLNCGALRQQSLAKERMMKVLALCSPALVILGMI